MTLETQTDVEQIRKVQDETGATVPPANQSEQAATNSRLGNFGSGADGSATDDTTGSTLSAGAVPEGVKVAVQAKHGNASRIKVGLTASPTVELKPGQSASFRVDDRSQINIVAKSSGDGVNWSHEVSA